MPHHGMVYQMFTTAENGRLTIEIPVLLTVSTWSVSSAGRSERVFP